MDDLLKKIHLVWNECKSDSESQELLDSDVFFRQEQQDLMKKWMACSIPEIKLKKLASIKGPTDYSNDDFNQVCADAELTNEEKNQLQEIVDNFNKRNNQVITLNNYGKKVPLAFSLSKFKTEGIAGDASKRTFCYFLDPQKRFPAKEEKLKEICKNLRIEFTDEALLSFMDSLKLDGSLCKNAANQTKLYWEILWQVFFKKTVWIVGASWKVDGKFKSFIPQMYDGGYWEGGASNDSQLDCMRSLKKGDIIAIKTHKNNRKDLDIRCVGILDNDSKESSKNKDWFSCPVSWVNNFSGLTYSGKYPSYNSTIRRCVDEVIVKELSKIIDGTEFKSCKETDNMQEYVTLLQNNHNIILHGAPGTGKTYLAKEIAKKMDCKGEQISFVQFHQSYDYTDFVEGLKPLKKDNSSDVYFEKVDGVFKSFCEKALKNLRNANDDNVSKNKTLQTLLDDFIVQKEDSEDEFTLKKGDHFKISHSDNRYIYIDNGEKKQDVKIAKKDMARLLELDNIENVVEIKKIFNRTHRQKDSYMFSLYGEIKKLTDKQGKSNNPPIENTSGDKEPLKKYVFIIDEINRGEMSKIFGELFYAIDPGYRISWDDIVAVQKNESTKAFVRTQYANMDNDPNEWDDVLHITEENDYGHFFVPENVYIIGTMNDIDRSVESMDFAMRRRFAFKEITADERIEMLDSLKCGKKNEAVKCMQALNKEIESISGLSSAYHIGPAYFLKLDNYEGRFEDLWKYHIEGVLREYLRGMPKAADHLKKLKECYDKSIASESSASSDNTSDSAENP